MASFLKNACVTVTAFTLNACGTTFHKSPAISSTEAMIADRSVFLTLQPNDVEGLSFKETQALCTIIKPVFESATAGLKELEANISNATGYQTNLFPYADQLYLKDAPFYNEWIDATLHTGKILNKQALESASLNGEDIILNSCDFASLQH